MSWKSDLTHFYDSRGGLIPFSDGVVSRDVRHPIDNVLDNPIMIVGEAPGEREVAEGAPFIGPAGKNLRGLIENHCRMSFNAFIISNAFPFRTVAVGESGKYINRRPSVPELRIGASLLKKEIEIVRPRLIILMGGSAIRAYFYLSGATLKIGDSTNFFGISVVSTYHPSPISYNRPDIKKALQEFFSSLA